MEEKVIRFSGQDYAGHVLGLGRILDSCLPETLWWNTLQRTMGIPISFCPSLPLSRVVILLLSTLPQGSISWRSSQMFLNAHWALSHHPQKLQLLKDGSLGILGLKQSMSSDTGGHPADFLWGWPMNIKIYYNYKAKQQNWRQHNSLTYSVYSHLTELLKSLELTVLKFLPRDQKLNFCNLPSGLCMKEKIVSNPQFQFCSETKILKNEK